MKCPLSAPSAFLRFVALAATAAAFAGALPGRAGAAPSTSAGAPALPVETVIDCAGRAEMVSSDTETLTTFSDQVVVTGNDIILTCDFLKVIAYRKGDPKATLGKYGAFKSLVATGHVRITQADRVATCGKAEVFPGEDRIVLTDDPVITSENPHSVASGPRMVLLRGQRRAIIEGTPGQRTHITLPALKDMGFHEPGKAAGTDGPGSGASQPSP